MRIIQLLFFYAISQSAMATTVSQKVGVYSDNLGSESRRLNFAIGLPAESKRSLLKNTSLDFTAGVGESKSEVEGDSDISEDRSWQLAMSYNLSKLNSVRLSLGGQSSEGNPSESYGLGYSQWFFKEQLQASIDLFKNNAIRDVIEVLDQDSEVISPPRNYKSEGASLSFRHLANPKTVFNYGYSRVLSNDRPDLWSASFGVKRFLENPWSSKYHAALHLDAARIENTGEIDTTTSIGQLRGTIYQAAWLQQFGDAQRVKAAYRQYREDETTRVNEDQYFLGTDLLSGTYVLELKKKTFKNFDNPLVVEATVHRYLTNPINTQGDKISANIYELGANTKF